VPSPIDVTVLWTRPPGYMGAAWRALSQLPEVSLTVACLSPGSSAPFVAEEVLKGVDWHLFESPDQAASWAAKRAGASSALVVAGWAHRAYRQVLPRTAIPHRVLAMDTPWSGHPRQLFGRPAYKRTFGCVDVALVPSDRAAVLARWLMPGPRTAITTGLYGVDRPSFQRAIDARAAEPSWPRKYVYTGRLAHDKGVDLLIDGYQRYRAAVQDPWPLVVAGIGPLQDELTRTPGSSITILSSRGNSRSSTGPAEPLSW
jgi:glycosyltransferase involved in cell wall biosynthesis